MLEVGVIGMGDMGRLYVRAFVSRGLKCNVCDLPSNYSDLVQEFRGNPQVSVFKDGFGVSRASDFIIYSVEAASIHRVVETFGPATKVGAIVGGQTSVKEPEILSFEKHLPTDVHIVTFHSLHGPKVSPKGQPLVVIRHRADDHAYSRALQILESLESNIVPLTYIDHDKITADTQAVTHVAFMSMGAAWKTRSTFPWENNRYLGGIDNVKILTSLRIFGNKWHVYAGLAIMNPSARLQVQQYSKSVSDLFMLMIQEKKQEFEERIRKVNCSIKHEADAFVFGDKDSRKPILLSDSILDQFSLSIIPIQDRKPNSHLSLLAIVDCWMNLGIRPYQHLICQTPPFRLLLGITEYLFSHSDFLDSAIDAAVNCKEIRADDLEFYRASISWVELIKYENMDGYRKKFEEISNFFGNRIPEAIKVFSRLLLCQKSAKLVELIAQKTNFD